MLRAKKRRCIIALKNQLVFLNKNLLILSVPSVITFHAFFFLFLLGKLSEIFNIKKKKLDKCYTGIDGE